MISVELTQDLQACHLLRRRVFIEEQSVSESDEVDGLDDQALHLLASQDGKPIGTARIFVAGETGKIGRVCVLAEMRGQKVGVALMRAAIDTLRQRPGVRQAKLGAQTHALGFYQALGFTAYGAEYLDAGIAHRDMVLAL